MTTHRERILDVIRGEMVDTIPYVPRIDLWYNANRRRGTLPENHRNRTADEIALSHGWALHKIVPEFLEPDRIEDIIHRGIGLVKLKEYTYAFEFSSDVEIEVDGDFDRMRVAYHTPVGSVSVIHGYTEEMKDAGVSAPWIQKHAIQGPEDYRVLAHIFGSMTFRADYDRFRKWEAEIGDNGLALESTPALNAGSPMHFIQKVLVDATSFFLHYHDYKLEMGELVEALAHCYDQILPILADSPATAVYWDANVDSMITYPAYMEKDLLPWWHKAADLFHARGKLMLVHPDGENRLLMDLLADCGADVCEAVTPSPMTKVAIDEYYDSWCRNGKLTMWGGIPESLLLEKSATNDEFESYLDHLFRAVAPGSRFIAGIGDTTPPDAVFDRLVRLGERLEKEGRLPLQAGGVIFVDPEQLPSRSAGGPDELAEQVSPGLPAAMSGPGELPDEQLRILSVIKETVLQGDNRAIRNQVRDALDSGCSPQDILNRGMLSAMEIIGGRFKDGTVFIPEVLLSARAMNDALTVLEPFLAEGDSGGKGSVMIGTVRGDLHDIGKNLVSTMLKGVGFEVIDLGINVKTEEFIAQAVARKPDILALSALLTTTMPQMKYIIDELEAAGLRSEVLVIIGGAPVNDRFAQDIGADGYASDAGEAVDLARRLLAGRNT
ncbi:MAG: corrinoid protein [Desulfofustis sp.]|nr:corrinoid protein [Desulfofustis sp.]